MTRFHLSVRVQHYEAAVADYTKRLGVAPCITHTGRYALWRTELLNLSIRCEHAPLVANDADAEKACREDADRIGLIWQYFCGEAAPHDSAAPFDFVCAGTA